MYWCLTSALTPPDPVPDTTVSPDGTTILTLALLRTRSILYSTGTTSPVYASLTRSLYTTRKSSATTWDMHFVFPDSNVATHLPLESTSSNVTLTPSPSAYAALAYRVLDRGTLWLMNAILQSLFRPVDMASTCFTTSSMTSSSLESGTRMYTLSVLVAASSALP